MEKSVENNKEEEEDVVVGAMATEQTDLNGQPACPALDLTASTDLLHIRSRTSTLTDVSIQSRSTVTPQTTGQNPHRSLNASRSLSEDDSVWLLNRSKNPCTTAAAEETATSTISRGSHLSSTRSFAPVTAVNTSTGGSVTDGRVAHRASTSVHSSAGIFVSDAGSSITTPLAGSQCTPPSHVTTDGGNPTSIRSSIAQYYLTPIGSTPALFLKQASFSEPNFKGRTASWHSTHESVAASGNSPGLAALPATPPLHRLGSPDNARKEMDVSFSYRVSPDPVGTELRGTDVDSPYFMIDRQRGEGVDMVTPAATPTTAQMPVSLSSHDAAMEHHGHEEVAGALFTHGVSSTQFASADTLAEPPPPSSQSAPEFPTAPATAPPLVVDPAPSMLLVLPPSPSQRTPVSAFEKGEGGNPRNRNEGRSPSPPLVSVSRSLSLLSGSRSVSWGSSYGEKGRGTRRESGQRAITFQLSHATDAAAAMGQGHQGEAAVATQDGCSTSAPPRPSSIIVKATVMASEGAVPAQTASTSTAVIEVSRKAGIPDAAGPFCAASGVGAPLPPPSSLPSSDGLVRQECVPPPLLLQVHPGASGHESPVFSDVSSTFSSSAASPDAGTSTAPMTPLPASPIVGVPSPVVDAPVVLVGRDEVSTEEELNAQPPTATSSVRYSSSVKIAQSEMRDEDRRLMPPTQGGRSGSNKSSAVTAKAAVDTVSALSSSLQPNGGGGTGGVSEVPSLASREQELALSFRNRIQVGVKAPARSQKVKKINAAAGDPRLSSGNSSNARRNVRGSSGDASGSGGGQRRRKGSARQEKEPSLNVSVPVTKFSVVAFAVLAHVRFLRQAAALRERHRFETVVAPLAAFRIQCSWRRYAQQRRIRQKMAIQSLVPWMRYRLQRLRFAKENSVRLLQRVFRGEAVRSFHRQLYRQMKLNAALSVIGQFVKRWEAQKLVHGLQLHRDERAVVIDQCVQGYWRVFRKEQQAWNQIIHEAVAVLPSRPSASAQDWVNGVAKLTGITLDPRAAHGIREVDAHGHATIGAATATAATTTADHLREQVHALAHLQDRVIVVPAARRNSKCDVAGFPPPSTDDAPTAADPGFSSPLLVKVVGDIDGSHCPEPGLTSGASGLDPTACPITDGDIIAAFVQLFMRVEATERMKLQQQLLTEHAEVLRAPRHFLVALQLASQSTVPPLFAHLLLAMAPESIMRRAARLFEVERKARLEIIRLYESMPLAHLRRSVLNPAAVARHNDLVWLRDHTANPWADAEHGERRFFEEVSAHAHALRDMHSDSKGDAGVSFPSVGVPIASQSLPPFRCQEEHGQGVGRRGNRSHFESLVPVAARGAANATPGALRVRMQPAALLSMSGSNSTSLSVADADAVSTEWREGITGPLSQHSRRERNEGLGMMAPRSPRRRLRGPPLPLLRRLPPTAAGRHVGASRPPPRIASVNPALKVSSTGEEPRTANSGGHGPLPGNSPTGIKPERLATARKSIPLQPSGKGGVVSSPHAMTSRLNPGRNGSTTLDSDLVSTRFATRRFGAAAATSPRSLMTMRLSTSAPIMFGSVAGGEATENEIEEGEEDEGVGAPGVHRAGFVENAASASPRGPTSSRALQPVTVVPLLAMRSSSVLLPPPMHSLMRRDSSAYSRAPSPTHPCRGPAEEKKGTAMGTRLLWAEVMPRLFQQVAGGCPPNFTASAVNGADPLQFPEPQRRHSVDSSDSALGISLSMPSAGQGIKVEGIYYSDRGACGGELPAVMQQGRGRPPYEATRASPRFPSTTSLSSSFVKMGRGEGGAEDFPPSPQRSYSLLPPLAIGKGETARCAEDLQRELKPSALCRPPTPPPRRCYGAPPLRQDGTTAEEGPAGVIENEGSSSSSPIAPPQESDAVTSAADRHHEHQLRPLGYNSPKSAAGGSPGKIVSEGEGDDGSGGVGLTPRTTPSAAKTLASCLSMGEVVAADTGARAAAAPLPPLEAVRRLHRTTP